MIALSWWLGGELSSHKFEGVAFDFGSVDLDLEFDVGSRAAESFLGTKILRYCIAHFPQHFLLQIAPISQRDIISGHVYTMLPLTTLS